MIVFLGTSLPGSALAGEPRLLISRKATRWRIWDRNFHDEASWQSWRQQDFDDRQWRQGHGVMGYGDADIETKLSFGDNPQSKPIAALFRARFRYEKQASTDTSVGGRIRCDDGAVVWVNGHEAFRHNLPAGDLAVTTFAVHPVGPERESEQQWHPFLIHMGDLRDGENIIAISVHQAKCTSSDLAMSCEVFELSEPREVAAFRQEVQQHRGVGDADEIKVRIGPVARLKFSR